MNSQWLHISTRSSPHQLFLAIKELSETQRNAVTKMGFGKMLNFNVDGIPTMLGHYVVDKFNQDQMEIDLGDRKIKIDEESISQLLGIPNRGILLSSLKYVYRFKGKLETWRERYSEGYILPSDIKKKMSETPNDDEDEIMFKLDFLTLFLSAMGEIRDGKCKLKFLHYIRDNTNLDNINWCSFIANSMSQCKTGWKRSGKKSEFTGPLTILVLMYVDRVFFPKYNVGRRKSPLTFWTKEQLSQRERFEIENGGFGRGKIRVDECDDESDLRSDEEINNESDEDGVEDDVHKDEEFTMHVSKLENLFECLARDKLAVEKALLEACSSFSNRNEIKSFIEKYKNMCKIAVNVEEYSVNAGGNPYDKDKDKAKDEKINAIIDSQYRSLKGLKMGYESFKQEVLKTQQIFSDEVNQFAMEMQGLADAADNYHTVLAENRMLYNEVQDLKGSIRVYCRVRPFPLGQSMNETIIEHIGNDGELAVTKPTTKESKSRTFKFKFDKVFGPTATQADVFEDTQPLIRSVLDGYDVCIFAYGATGSGKTYTMTGPDTSSPEDWGVNYRALNDLFHISEIRKNSYKYEIEVQMFEIYNEQIRDLLSSDRTIGSLKISHKTQEGGPTISDLSTHQVTSTTDVINLMKFGLKNRAVGATALNERSSRSHSVLTVHVLGTDLKTNDILCGKLHLVDLAGSERPSKSDVVEERLSEAKHINTSLSALGTVMSALAQKSQHVPYRNSKLTTVLRNSLEGRAKTLMFVQLDPDVGSFSETYNSLMFAQRVSGVELGAARSKKKRKGVEELTKQVSNLKMH